MKRARNIVCIAGLLAVMMTSTAFAEGDLEITGSYPEDGQKNTTIENVAAKIQFSKDVGNKKNQEANSKCFSMVDEDGEELPIRVYYNPEDPKEVLVLADTTEMNAEKITVKDNSDYTVKVTKDFTADDGSTLGTDGEITFKTLNQSRNNMVYMVMMFLMFGGMFFFTSRQMKKHMAEENEGRAKEEPFNPYKEAKKTGKSGLCCHQRAKTRPPHFRTPSPVKTSHRNRLIPPGKDSPGFPANAPGFRPNAQELPDTQARPLQY